MSTAQSGAARALPTHEAFVPSAPRPAERLRLVQAPVQPRSRAPFVLLCIGLLAAALLGTLVMNTVMNNEAYAAREVQLQIAKEAELADVLGEQIDALSSPQALAARATELGMVQSPDPGVLRLSDLMIFGGASGAAQ